MFKPRLIVRAMSLQTCTRWNRPLVKLIVRRVTVLVFAGVSLLLVSCQPVSKDLAPTPLPTQLLPPTPTAVFELDAVTLQVTNDVVIDSLEQPPPPTPFPTATNLTRLPTPENWQTFIDLESGLMMSAPPEWVDVGQLANIESLKDLFGAGQLLLFADHLETGVQVLTGRPLEQGAFVLAFIPEETAQPKLPFDVGDDPYLFLDELLRKWSESATVQIVPQGRLSGAFAYVDRDPTELIDSAVQNTDLQIGLMLDKQAMPATPIYLLLGESRNENGRYAPVFADMLSIMTYRPEVNTQIETLRFLDLSSATGGQDAIIGRLPKDNVTYWAFEADAGRYATFNLTPDGSSDLTLTLLAPSGRTLAEQDNGFGGDPEILLDVLLPESGVYVIQISEFFSVEDRYTLSVGLSDDAIYRNGGRIMLNQQLTGKLTVGQDDTWVFNGRADQNVSIIVNPQTDFDIIFTLYGLDGTEIATFDEGYSGDTEVLGNYILPFTGEYAIGVRSFGEVVGEYTIALDEGNQTISNFFEAGDLIYGGVVSEFLREEEAQVWFLSGRAGDLITIDAQPLTDALDLDVWLLDSTRERLVMKDGNLAGEPEQIIHKLPRDGDYLIVVQDFFGESGEYEIRLAVSEENYLLANGVLPFDEAFESTLPAGRGAIWQFEGEVGDIVSIVLEPVNPETDFSLSLRTPGNQPILQVDETLAGGTEQIVTFELTENGLWGIVVQEYFENGGAYQLQVAAE